MLLLYGDIELAVRHCKTLEARLKREHGAQGETLGQLIKSVKGKLPSETMAQLDQVKRMRNELVHEEGQNSLESRREFEKLCAEIEKLLDRLEARKSIQRIVAVTFIVVAAILMFYLAAQNLP